MWDDGEPDIEVVLSCMGHRGSMCECRPLDVMSCELPVAAALRFHLIIYIQEINLIAVFNE